MLKEGVVLSDRYEVIGAIGAGGMADVYKGKDRKLNRYVAIKVLKREFGEDELFVRKFKTEAQSAAGLMHPNVVNVYDVGEDRGYHYMVMELVEGITLKDYIQRKGRLMSKEVISIAIQICLGIEAAHNKQIIHRDIKPQNIIISKEGKVKVTDFGIARATTSNTVSTNAMGSVHYTSPEQARGGFSDEKSDVYSTGITMYEMITGSVPFDGDTTVSVAIKHLQEEILPPSELAQDIPYGLEQIIMKCTKKESNRRYPSMQALILDLKRALLDPDGEFVVIPPVVNREETIMITESELEEIQERSRKQDDDEYDDDYDDEYDDDYDDDDEYDKKEKKDNKKKNKKGDINPKMSKVTKILLIVVAVIIAFTLIFMIGKAVGLFKFGPGTTANDHSKEKVPLLVGLEEEKATAELKKKGLEIKVVERIESEQYGEGIIIQQKPAAGSKIDKTKIVEVVVSSGLKQANVRVPDLIESTEDEAKAKLDEVGLVIDRRTENHNEIPNGSVISTSPQGGAEAPKGSKVIVVISMGPKRPEKVEVPNVLGQTVSDAKQVLSGFGFAQGEVKEEFSTSIAAGLIISTQPTAGTKLEKGSSISFVVSKGVEVINATVPSVVGKTRAEAEKAITEAGFIVGKVIYQAGAETPETVIDIEPKANSVIGKGEKVTIYVSNGAGAASE